MTQDIINAKNAVNRRNIELGTDKDLVKIKYLRLELSRLMKVIKDSSVFSRYELDIDMCDELNLPGKIKALEQEKAKLDAKIQFSNWTNSL